MLAEHLTVPFQTTVLGMTVTVTRVDLTVSDQIIAICLRDRVKQPIPILDLPLPNRRAIAATVAPRWRIRTSSWSRSEITGACGNLSNSIESSERNLGSASAAETSARISR